MHNYRKYLLDVLSSNFTVNQSFVGAEVGCWRGGTSSLILSSFPQCKLIMVDPWEKGAGLNPTQSFRYQKANELEGSRIKAAKAVQFAGDRVTIIHDFSVEGAKQVPDDSLDFVFIDGNHLYDHVVQDLLAWFPKVKSGGIVSGDDYASHPKRWLVWKAVDEFLSEHSYELQGLEYDVWWFRK